MWDPTTKSDSPNRFIVNIRNRMNPRPEGRLETDGLEPETESKEGHPVWGDQLLAVGVRDLVAEWLWLVRLLFG